MRKLLIFCGFHYDVAYRKTFEGYLPQCLQIIDAALDMLDTYDDYVFCIEQVILVDVYWQRRGENRDRLKKHAQAGRLIFCPGTWTMPDGNIPSAESCYRNALLGRKWLLEHLGVEPGPICWMADIFGHHAQSPQIYRQLGYRMYMFERGQLEAEETVDFLWQGIDGTKLLTHWEVDTYFGLVMGLYWLGQRDEEMITQKVRREIVEPLEKGSSSGDLFSKVGGDFRLPRTMDLEYIQRWNDNGWRPKIEFAHPDRYIDQVEKRSDLKVIHAELNPLFQGTYASRIRLKQFNRRMENLAYAQEALATRTGQGIDTEPLWKAITTQQFHDIICGSLADEAWKEAIDTYERMHRRTCETLTRHLRAKGGSDVVVFNPLPYERSEVVDLPDGPARLTVDAMQVVTAERARSSADVPPVRTEGRILDNGLIRAVFDEFGRLKCLRDLTTKQIYEDPRFGYIHDVFREPDYGDPWVYHKGAVNYSLLHTAAYHDPPLLSEEVIVREGLFFTRGTDSQCYPLPNIEAMVEGDGCRASILVRQQDLFTIRYALHAGEKLLRICVRHRFRAPQSRVRAVMPTGILDGRIRREIPGGWIEQPQGEYPAQNWMDYANEQKGLCLLNRGLPGNNVTDGVMMLTLFRAVAIIEPNVMPDFEIDVPQQAEYALYTFTPDDPHYHPWRLGRCFNQPLVTATYAATLEDGGLRITLQSATAELLAVRPAEKPNTIEIRLHDASGKPSTVQLETSKPVRAACRITPMGRPLGQVEMDDRRRLRLRLGPFEIATLALEMQQ